MQYAGGSPPRNVSGFRHPMMLAGLCTKTITPWVGAQSKEAWEDQVCRRVLQVIVYPIQLALSCAPRRLPVPGSRRLGQSGNEIVVRDNMQGDRNSKPGGHLNGTSPPALLNKIYSFQSVNCVIGRKTVSGRRMCCHLG